MIKAVEMPRGSSTQVHTWTSKLTGGQAQRQIQQLLHYGINHAHTLLASTLYLFTSKACYNAIIPPLKTTSSFIITHTQTLHSSDIPNPCYVNRSIHQPTLVSAYTRCGSVTRLGLAGTRKLSLEHQHLITKPWATTSSESLQTFRISRRKEYLSLLFTKTNLPKVRPRIPELCMRALVGELRQLPEALHHLDIHPELHYNQELMTTGVSLLTQLLYAIVFISRYLDLLLPYTWSNHYNLLFKLTYIATSLYILFLQYRVFPRSRESETQWKLAGLILAFAVVTAPIFHAIFRDRAYSWSFLDLTRHFSWIVESVAVIPQLVLLAHTSVPTVINSYYLVALGSYRALYIPNWILRYFAADTHLEPAAVIFGVLQTALYIEFAWIYINRQRVKLRNGGGVLDGDEFARGLILGRLIKKEKMGERRVGGGWRGGVSVSADDFEVGGAQESDDDDELQRETDVEQGLIGRREGSAQA
jgi:hypothetical protein